MLTCKKAVYMSYLFQYETKTNLFPLVIYLCELNQWRFQVYNDCFQIFNITDLNNRRKMNKVVMKLVKKYRTYIWKPKTID